MNPDRNPQVNRRALRRNGIALLVAVALVVYWQIASRKPAQVRPVSSSTEPGEAKGSTKWDLWTEGTKLRGANLWLKRVLPEDGRSLGQGIVGPPYTEKDFSRLAALGANYVNISFPGLYTEKEPYHFDHEVARALDGLLEKAQAADLFAVLAVRTGPGRDELNFEPSRKNEANLNVWKAPAAQAAWVAMWSAIATRYRYHPVLVGYEMMVEPNANDSVIRAGMPSDFYPQFARTTLDWNPLAKKLTDAVRAVDPDVPLLVGGMGYSNVRWLDSVTPTGDPKTAYVVHHYDPFEFTHQSEKAKLSYPSAMAVEGENLGFVDRSWIEKNLTAASRFKAKTGQPIAVTEFGAMRWVPGASQYLTDSMNTFEKLGANYAVWLWESSSSQITYDEFNFRRGVSPSLHTDDETNPNLMALRAAWSRNVVRPSGTPFID